MRYGVLLLATVALTACGGAKTAQPPIARDTESQGCGYLLHDAKRYESISARWDGTRLRWDEHPQQRGGWTPVQQRASPDNAKVGAGGTLTWNGPSVVQSACIGEWNRLPAGAWQRADAQRFDVARVAEWHAAS